ncbi:DNA polymerase III subunit alpha [Candidatus Pantoea edessiphila]|uniref:DNA polymerase III subunit alpha n=1 Tax=Candidatus Pantoea edessiphila TaxID=2044610 RepID=A0A2P5SY32_9GAMM|nr:DNA polymerase III subunit alpha [Candidatus Pantoea edessiphila]MBK4775557.1 DNA polymerase III subunit alpha [Pantoea sp. Edef]PPI87210.1 DNA polymerase III subunit alpha [Candidatus Pantoea edessiphila]
MNIPRFIHLRVHSDYSIIDGLITINSLVKNAYLLGMPSIAITDFTNLFGLVQFYSKSHDIGIKPIIGSDFNVKNKLFGNKLTKITILASSNIGYNNLILLISRAYKRGYGIAGPTIDLDWLGELKEGLIILSGGRLGDIGCSLLLNNNALVTKCLDFYKKHFANRYYLELIRTGRPDEENYLNAAVNLSINEQLPVLATNEVCFVNQQDFYAHEIRVAIHNGWSINDDKRPCNYSSQQYMRSEDEMCNLFSDIPEALKNSVEIAKRCNVTLELGKHFLPKFPTGNISPKDFLIKKSKVGLDNKLTNLFKDPIDFTNKKVQYYKRLKFELDTINQMGFPSYFLIVMEFIQWAKDNNIPVGPGRGSGAGSLVAYVLNITDIDPIKFDLLFERFLNSERISMPDFDIDFCMNNRDKVINHVNEIYGKDAVSQIITFGTMAAKAVIRDVGRVLGYPYGFIDRIAKLIPSDIGMTLKKAFLNEKRLLDLYQTDDDTKILIDTAIKLEGIIRSIGKHAGGVVISPTKISDFTPIYCDENGANQVTQFDKNDVEYIGLVKFDFLGLKTLTIINSAIKMVNIQNLKQEKPLVNINEISLKDKVSFDMLQSAETTAIFQLESRGIKDLIKRLKPDRFEDIIALVALFRPGPLKSGMVDNFINRKHGREIISYPDINWQHNILKPILESTYGIILYQEQVMQIAQVLAGYTPGKADILRRAMSKKNPEEMAHQRSFFIKGAQKLGVNVILATKIFDLLEKFAGYGFNKSHSTAYALISYQTLWLKSHYPVEFMAAAMTADIDNTEKIVELIDECFRMNIKVLPPDINLSLYEFISKEKEILYGMGAIKGLGKIHIQMIIDIRNKEGCFKNFFDFCKVVIMKKINRRVIEKLIMSGALDCLDCNRASMISSIDKAFKFAHQSTHIQESGQFDMFGVDNNQKEQVKRYYKNVAPWSEKKQLDAEKESLGLYLTGHPIKYYLKEINYYSNGISLKDANLMQNGRIISAVGMAIDIKIMITKSRNRLAICTLDDSTGRLEVIVYTEILEKYQSLLKKDNILIVKGQTKIDNFGINVKLIAQEIMDIQQARLKYVRALSIIITGIQYDSKLLDQISKLMNHSNLGAIPVNIYVNKKDMQSKLIFNKNWLISLDGNIINELQLLLGNSYIEFEFN